MKKIILGLLIIATIILGGCATNDKNNEITTFEECVTAGNTVMESYPRQCVADGQTFTEEINDSLIGGDEDENGCLIAAGYQWCPSTQQCQRMWETYCEEYAERYKEPQICTKEYMPVCGEQQVQCVRAPCNPINVTFANRCEAEAAGATNIREGVCEEKEVNLEGACLSFDGIWSDEYQECEGMPQDMCEQLNGTYNECASACRHDPDAEFCTLQCIQTCTFV